jgi:hypothetical protein
MCLFIAIFMLMTFLATPAVACSRDDAVKGNIEAAWHGEVIDAQILDSYSCAELFALLNVVYARHGYIFKDELVRGYFEVDPRYQSDEYVNDFTIQLMLTPNDRYTIFEIEWNQFTLRTGASRCDSSVPWASTGKQEEPQDEERPDERVFAPIEETVTDAAGIVTITCGVATTQFIIDQVLLGEVIEKEWLAPLTCKELDRVGQAAYVAYDIPLPDREDREFFFSVWPYNPDYSKTVPNVQMKSVHQLALLRVDMVKEDKHCP